MKLLAEYQTYHRHPVNQLIHLICIPLIAASIVVVFFNPWVGAGLFVGGHPLNSSPFASCEVYDGVESKILPDSLKQARFRHLAVSLSNGDIVVVGGLGATSELFGLHLSMFGVGKVERFSAAQKSWTDIGEFGALNFEAAAVRLKDDRVLVCGGGSNLGDDIWWPSNTVKIIGPDYIQDAGPMSVARSFHTATVLPDGRVLAIGGFDGIFAQNSAEIYDPTADTWSALPPMATSRLGHTATLLSDLSVLVVGGRNQWDFHWNSCEILRFP